MSLLPGGVMPSPRRHRCAESGEAIEDGGMHLKLGDLAVDITRHHSLAERFDTAHFGFHQTASMVASAWHGVWRCAPQPPVAGLSRACRFCVQEKWPVRRVGQWPHGRTWCRRHHRH